MPNQYFLHLLNQILKNDKFLLYWTIFAHYIGKAALGMYLNIILKIITDTSVYDTGLLQTQCNQTVRDFKYWLT